MGKFRLIEATADGGYTWLGIVIVIGSMISLAYYLPVVAMMWREEAQPAPAQPGVDPATGRAALAGAAPEAGGEGSGGWETQLVALVMGAAILFFGIVPQPLFDLVQHAAAGILGLR